MSEYIKLDTASGTSYHVKRWDINRIIQHAEGSAVVYLDQGEKDDLAVGTNHTADEIIDLINGQEKAEDAKHDKRMGRRDERIKEAVLESLKTGKDLVPQDAGDIIDEVLGE